MKKPSLILVSLALTALTVFVIKRQVYDPFYSDKKETHRPGQFNDLRSGDLIFQTSLSPQSKAIQLATRSKYSHCGLIYKEDGRIYVFEAVQPVKRTPLDQWIAKGRNGAYVVKRLKNAAQVA